ncbi:MULTISPECIES: twin-arginine translocase subunit TatC [unclassified Saccharibacter]|uniref:twin-arginine translocase subunit TatC n=1 Tax=unclassified Saccharibacter TaxID=2648722 RepID=UPI00132168D5|nr:MULTISPECIES: twin-arginine translocase subunit TatC [unclassified Saccharibacter]MXV36093.1 twin-arginine translocase subunit TatC [Saccharibacter sp. EH611]MXV56952.1 twin-arginine translocase subunit TatC [Saccharibacter sp. EH70]MXV66688.1 twin-arginine translocase subunit TatC [Saccharibacter sp. EH60]
MAASEESTDKPMPLLDHLVELRRRLIWSIATFIIAFGICYHFSGEIYRFLAAPLAEIMRQKNEQPHLIYTALYEAFFTYLRVAVFGAIFLSFPMIAIQAWIFIAPGLYRDEKRAFAPFLVATPVLFLLGAALAYYLVFPMAWKFFLSFQQTGGASDMGIQLQARVSEYLDLVTKMILAFGTCFELPVVLTLLVRVGLVQTAQLRRVRRYAYVGAFAVSAVIAPPDAITMLSLAIPLVILYEISILAARLVEPRRVDEDDDENDDEPSHPHETTTTTDGAS